MTRHLDSFVCPITHDVMVDPVVTVDGHSYERSAIEEWIRTSHETAPGGQVTSPATNLPLGSTQLIPNLALKRSIGEYRNKHNVLPGSPAGPLRSPSRLAVVVPPALALAPVDLPRTEALPQVGYDVYRANVTLAIYSQPSFNYRVSSAHGTALELPAGELFVVTKRLYSAMFGNTTGYVFLQLGTHNDVELRNCYVAEQAERPPHARLVERVPAIHEVAVYMADRPSPFYARPTTHSDSALVRHTMLRRDELVATDLRVADPVTNQTYLRLDNSFGWLPLRHLTRYECTTRRLLFRVPSPTHVYRNIRTVPESIAVATLPADYLLASTLHVYLNAFAYTRVVRDDVTGWCKLRLSDMLLQCPPRLAEQPPGRSIPVALLQGDHYFVLLNEIQDDGTITQAFHCDLPYAMVRQINNCITKGRHVTHAALGPKDEWYLSATRPDGSGAHCWASENVSEDFRNVMTVNSRVAFGPSDAFVLVDDHDVVYWSGVSYSLRLELRDVQRVHARRKHKGPFFMKHSHGVITHDFSDVVRQEVLEASPPRGHGQLVSVSCSEGRYVAIYDNWFATTDGVQTDVTDVLAAFYNRHLEVRNDRRRLIQRYQAIA
ncbi:hypothetical protein SPRG_03328 [Saprolegnia parasitica CBS 223.65]|uniref:U-box domain-containing protein n=1 Tax=Saprolegnia parasitica (strain CBS 223.65) TaxID=695850 RepID=A0A067CS94_SAPPC|nr:hypothetical protein SPRG_03328 [Saprolegnia parasitica CBS 223.65]KDO32110.1 hypothetical protein SPRG_03328 [Saprolegnia parasitica CBS 223.65]|eukprot:XP_012197295.1 hypothetical protein SPRG_03328 [Saprolegnia parasitica CBS 223.65]